MHRKQYIIFLLLLFCALIQAQDGRSKSVPKRGASYELSKSLEDGEPDEKVAQDYEKVAKEYVAKGEYAKAEEYLEKAKKLYIKLNDKEKIALVERELAKVQEVQNKVDEAITNYNSAGKLLKGKVQGVVSQNDAYRLQNRSNPEVQSGYIRQNIEALSAAKNKGDVSIKEDKALAYQQMAQINLEMNEKKEAISNLESALEEVKDKPEEAIKINRNIANVYAADKKYDKAIEINEKMLEKAKSTNNPVAQIEQLQSLSSNYLDQKETEKGISSLKEAYSLAVEQAHTIEAKRSLEMLANQYKKENNPKKALELYSDFMDRLETLIKSDSSLIDAKLFQINEDRIAQLEKERELKDELISEKNLFNYVLIGSIILILIFLSFIVKALYSIKKKNKKIALQSLRREMNPHFIFNSLNSVNQFIAQNNELEANKYLSSYSKLMRNMMENSNKDFIPLSLEIDQLKEYLDLEHLRFRDKFSYRIDIDESIDADAVYVPNMLIQPQLENAIWHGLRYKDGKGLLRLSVKQPDENTVCIVVEDDGIGLTKSHELKTTHQKSHQSRGMANTYERINLLNNLYNSRITINVSEKSGDATGVVVSICFPLSNHKDS